MRFSTDSRTRHPLSANEGPLAASHRRHRCPSRRIGDKLAARGIDLWYTDCDGDVRGILGCLYYLDLKEEMFGMS